MKKLQNPLARMALTACKRVNLLSYYQHGSSGSAPSCNMFCFYRMIHTGCDLDFPGWMETLHDVNAVLVCIRSSPIKMLGNRQMQCAPRTPGRKLTVSTSFTFAAFQKLQSQTSAADMLVLHSLIILCNYRASAGTSNGRSKFCMSMILDD